MQHPSSAALLSAIFAFTLAAAGSLPKGVGPEFASHYKGKEKFFCITNAAIKLSLSQINDNSPYPVPSLVTTNVTNALPGFWCANEGHIGMYVPFLYVNDGVCDYDLCCDGSEEYKGVGGVRCENRCSEIGKE
ncbi:protein kinase C substrate 80K-H [Fusarium oxysporum f. sp. melonis 26406]|uniref:Protein kinase C substrate 80K-H n=1 Tax=Fusarium oxysporum f. sp. melonis 26406 TaxID=1089452 RepID=W9Z7M3_FUSOX|nr:protein kinase C substrate 80K-H [Fusarium oxysporum f. sp. melonis 26406]